MVCNTDSGAWLKAMADVESEGAITPLQVVYRDSERGNCDICDSRPWDRHGFVCGIETYYCLACAGETEAA